MKKNNEILGLITCVIVLTAMVIAIVNVNIVDTNNIIYRTSLKEVEAHASVSEGSDLRSYSCVKESCTISYLGWTFYGTHEKCKDGNISANCNCSDCDAL
jgi:hypothetical protein